MIEQTAHPSTEELNAFSLGQLPADAAVVVESHVSECQPCCDTLLGLSSDDTFVGLLQEAEQLPPGQTVDHGLSAPQSSSSQDVPVPLAEHPRYEVLRLIGKGGMGDVYEARHRKMNRTVALKVINRELFQKPEAVNRFHREVMTAAQLSHPNIVTSHDADQAGEYHFMVMEYVDGIDLSHVVKDRGALPIAEACDYIRQAAIGLQHAHERGMVHRDIKPHNLMVTADGTIKILDFGLASLAPEATPASDAVAASSDLTAVGAIMGTPDFISPEQAEDARQADIRSDIYSLGTTLYSLLTGRPPFADGSIMHKLKSHAQVEPEPLESLRDEIPADLAAIVSKMIAKDPADRFQTPAEAVAALESFARAGQEVTLKPSPGHQVQRRRWKPTFLSLTAIAALFVAALFAGLIYYVQTDHGVVRVEVTDPSLEVSILDHTITMKDGDGKPLTIRPGEQSLIVRKDDADFEFETDNFQIRRGDKIAVKVEYVKGEVVVRKDGERFNSKALPDDVKVEQILDRMAKAYAQCESYRDSGVIKSAFLQNTVSPEFTVEYSFTTAFVRPDRFRFEIKDEDDDKSLISVNGQNVQTWWDIEPGIQKPESLELAMAQAVGFSGGDVGRIPAMLMPQKLDGGVDLDLIDPRQIEDGKLQNVKCFRLEYNFRDEQIILWIDKQSYLVRRIDERVESDGIRIERTTTYDPTIDGKITAEMLEFLPEGDLKQIQGDWDVIAFTQDGTKEFAADKGVGMLVQIKGETITRIQTAPNGEKVEKEWGRIELNSKANPKSIDIVNPDGPGGRLLGIYALTDGTLKICFAERSNIDVKRDRPVKRPTKFAAPAGSGRVLIECGRKRPEANTRASSPHVILDQGYKILDVGKEIGSRHLVVTENDQSLSISDETSLALKFDGVPPGIVELDVSAVYSVTGDTPRFVRATTSAKEQGTLVMHGTVEFEDEVAIKNWTTYKDSGRKLEPPRKQQATLKKPQSGPLVLDSTIQVVGPLLLPEDGERKFVRVRFNNEVREGKPLLEFEADCKLRRTSRPDGAGFTITVLEPESDEPEMTWEYDRNGNCQSIELSRTTVMKPHEVADDGSDKEEMPDIEAERKTTAFLIESAKQGDVAAVNAALKAGVNPNGPANQLTALHWAVAKRLADGETIDPSPEIAKLLVDAGADVNAKDYLDQTPLEWAAKYASPEIVQMLIKAGADVNAESRYGTVLLAATVKMQMHGVENAKLLIEAGADVNAGQTTTPLANAVQFGNLKMIHLLIDKGAAVNDAKNPPLSWAGKPEVAKALLEAGADVNLRNGKGETVLHFPNGQWFGPNPETITLLIEAGADVNAKTKTESTPLHAAVQQAKPDIVKVLIAAGAHVDAKDQKGNTPLSLAHGNVAWARSAPNVESQTYEATVQLLVDAGAKDDGRTELQQAVATGDLEQVEKLIAAKADVNEAGPQRITAMHLASNNGHTEILAALTKAGAKVDAADAQGMRPLHLAANAETARLLIAKGANVNTGMPSPLYMATMNGKADVVRELLRNDANAKDRDCTTMLNWATFAGQIGVVNVLFELRDAKTLLAVKSTYSPLHVAASGSFGDMSSSASAQQRLDIAKVLVENGADVNRRWGANVDPKSGAAHMINTTPLMFASQRGEAEMVKFLLDQKADVQAKNASGQTALHFAAQYGHRDVVEFLLKAKADVNALTREAKTPLDLTEDAAVRVLLTQNGGKTSSELLKDAQR